jgi:hypothetical protein
MAKKKVVSLKDRVMEQIALLKKKVEEQREASENPKADKAFRETRKKLKRLQRKWSRMTALEKRAEARVKKPAEEETPKEEAAPKEEASA